MDKKRKAYLKRREWAINNKDKVREYQKRYRLKKHGPPKITSTKNGFKICIRCGEEKEYIKFCKNKACKNGINGVCKQCAAKAISILWRKRNPPKPKRVPNKERLSAYQKEYREKNKEKIRLAARKRERDRRNSDPLFKLSKCLKHRMRQSIKSNKWNKKNKSSELLGADIEIVKKHIENKFTKGMNWSNHGNNGWHIDHIIPLSSAKTEEELITLFHYTNLQPLWAKDNRKKLDKIIEGSNQLKLTI